MCNTEIGIEDAVCTYIEDAGMIFVRFERHKYMYFKLI